MDAKYAMRTLTAAEYAQSLIHNKNTANQSGKKEGRNKKKRGSSASPPQQTQQQQQQTAVVRPCRKLIKASLELSLAKVPSNVEAFSCTSEIFRYNMVKVVAYILTQASTVDPTEAAKCPDKDQPTRRQSTSCSRRSFEYRTASRHTLTLETFVMRFREYTSAGPEIFLLALILIDRFTEKAPITSENVNKLWTAAFISASKLYDDFYNT